MSETISKASVCEILADIYPTDGEKVVAVKEIDKAYETIQQLPPAHPERPKGKWIEFIPEHGECPFCGNQVDLLNGKANTFCGECGADMRGEQDGNT